MTQLVGQPFYRHLEAGVDVNDREALRALNREVAGAVSELLDRARALGRESV
jgi:hypothetical protein